MSKDLRYEMLSMPKIADIVPVLKKKTYSYSVVWTAQLFTPATVLQQGQVRKDTVHLY